MAEKKISQLTAKSANLDATDLIPIAESDGLGGYVTKHITGAEVVGGAGSTTIYNGDSQLSGDRTIDCDNNFLKFAKLEYLYFQSFVEKRFDIYCLKYNCSCLFYSFGRNRKALLGKIISISYDSMLCKIER